MIVYRKRKPKKKVVDGFLKSVKSSNVRFYRRCIICDSVFPTKNKNHDMCFACWYYVLNGKLENPESIDEIERLVETSRRNKSNLAGLRNRTTREKPKVELSDEEVKKILKELEEFEDGW